MSRTHLVTGAAGLIGYEITRQLLEEGDSVHAVDIYLKGGKDGLKELKAEFPENLHIYELDLTHPITGLPEASWDTIYHMAAIVGVAYVNENPYKTVRVNSLSTIHILDFAIRAGCKTLAFASTGENYASGVTQGWVPLPTPEKVPLIIDDIGLARWSYAASKIAGESAVLGAGPVGDFKPVVIRFHNVYGPRMGQTHVIPEFLERCRQKVDPFPVYGYDATRSFLHVEDGARAVRLAADTMKEGGVINVGSPEEIEIAQLVDLVFEVSGHHPEVRKEAAPPGSVRRRVPDVSQLMKLGFQPRIALKEGIASCFHSPGGQGGAEKRKTDIT